MTHQRMQLNRMTATNYVPSEARPLHNFAILYVISMTYTHFGQNAVVFLGLRLRVSSHSCQTALHGMFQHSPGCRPAEKHPEARSE